MTEKDQKFIAYWETVMQRGRMKYAVLHGFLFGLLIFLFTFIFPFFFDDSLDAMFRVPKIFITFLIFCVGGMVFEGGYIWWMNSKKYRKLISNPD